LFFGITVVRMTGKVPGKPAGAEAPATPAVPAQ